MKPITKEWISKAEADWNSAGHLFRARKDPYYDAACFHTQQCAEKYVKARLEEAGIAFAKTTPDLKKLMRLVLAVEPSWSALGQDLIFLTAFALDSQCPGNTATKAEAKEAITRCGNVRRVVRRAFGLKP